MFVCDMATMFPMSIESMASVAIIIVQSARMPGSAVTNTRRKAENAAAFRPTDMKAVTEVGAPS